jgi:hypothetical protein
MALLGTILRARRGDFNLFLIAALVALLVVPGAAHAAPLPPQSYEAVLFWLQAETSVSLPVPSAVPVSLLSISHQKAEKQPQTSQATYYSLATSHCGQHTVAPPSLSLAHIPLAPVPLKLERHVVAHLSGIRTNRRLI